QWMIAPNPDLKVHVAEKFASSIVAAAHSSPPIPFGASESLLRSGGEDPFNSLLAQIKSPTYLISQCSDRTVPTVLSRCG
ncbi:hypothetical protein NKH61_32055, partial [Mesorhizobium sp. M1005]|uniref:hypothetical protein n=1 Tax=Mesorhizobium sp. M1005 TaxID=2957047 RepID=UPI0033358282